MIDFIQQNLGSIIVGVILLVIIAAAVVKIIRDKRAGKCSCGCEGCAGCSKRKSPIKYYADQIILACLN